MFDPKCEAGCISFDGGEKKHHRDCAYYPESLTKLWHETEAEYLAEIERLRAALRDVIGMLDDPTGNEHVRDMRGATVIARAALKEPKA